VKTRTCTSCGEKPFEGACIEETLLFILDILDIIISLTQVASRGRGGIQVAVSKRRVWAHTSHTANDISHM